MRYMVRVKGQEKIVRTRDYYAPKEKSISIKTRYNRNASKQDAWRQLMED